MNLLLESEVKWVNKDKFVKSLEEMIIRSESGFDSLETVEARAFLEGGIEVIKIIKESIECGDYDK